jgi:putative transposase
MRENGKNYIKIDTFTPSSKECRMCHTKHTELKLNDRMFVCPACGHTEDRDLHAAQNIKRFGLKQVSEQAGISCNVKCSSSAIRARTRAGAKDLASLLNGSLEAPTRVSNPTWRE